MDDNINPYQDLHMNSFNDGQTRNIQHTTSECSYKQSFLKYKKTCTCFTSFIKNHFYVYIIVVLLICIFLSNIYNSYIFSIILNSVHKKSSLENFVNTIDYDYNFILQYLLQNNITFKAIVNKINNSLGLFANMSHNSYLACTSDLLIPTIDHEKCYKT